MLALRKTQASTQAHTETPMSPLLVGSFNTPSDPQIRGNMVSFGTLEKQVLSDFMPQLKIFDTSQSETVETSPKRQEDHFYYDKNKRNRWFSSYKPYMSPTSPVHKNQFI